MAKLRVFSGERRPLACSSRQLAANLYSMFLWSCALRNAFGKLPNATGWQPIRLRSGQALCSPAPLRAQIVEFPAADGEIIHVGQRMSDWSC